MSSVLSPMSSIKTAFSVVQDFAYKKAVNRLIVDVYALVIIIIDSMCKEWTIT